VHSLQQLTGFLSQGRSALLTEREVVQSVADRTDDATPRTSALRTERIGTGKSGSTETANIVFDISAARFAEVGIRVEFCTTVRTRSLADRVTTRFTIDCLGIIDSATMRALDTCSSTHPHLLLGGPINLTSPSHLLALSLQHSITGILRVKRNIFVHNLAFYHNLGAKI
jgi:hypothetical protein